MRVQLVVGLVSFVFAVSRPAILRAQSLPVVKAVSFRAEVTSTTGGGVLSYNYRIANLPPSSGAVWRIEIDISKPAGGIDLSSEGLVNGPGFLEHMTGFVLQQPETVPMVPVGLSAPAHWLAGLDRDGTVSWGTGGLFQIQPGQSLSGLQMTTRGLPAIRQIVAKPYIDVDTLTIKPPEDQTDVQRYVSEFDALESSVSAKGLTVGPTAPPADFKPLEFLKTIQSYKDQAVKQGWIDDLGVANSLDVKLNSAQHALERQENTTAKDVLSALLNEVEAQANKHLSSEAVALLKFNTQHLISKIP